MLPEWEAGTPAVLIAAGPHAIPVSTAVRRGDRRVVFALGARRSMLARLREGPEAALCVLGAGVAFTAYGRAAVVREELDAAPVAAVELQVERVQDHLADGRTEMLDGARYEWRDAAAAEAEPRIRAELGTI
jgi:hypothetical protein